MAASFPAKVANFISKFWYVWSVVLQAAIDTIFTPKHKGVSEDIVLITGAGSGIGRLLAVDFASRGARVIVCDINKENNAKTCKMISCNGGLGYSYVCDVTDNKAVYELAKKVKKDVGRVTILVNNAGVLYGDSFLKIPDEKIVQTFQVNSLGPMWLCKAFLPDMLKANNGHIVNLASMGGHFGTPKLSDYCASKNALIGFDESLKTELHLGKHTGVHTSIVFPNFFKSGLFDGMTKLMTSEYVAKELMKGILTNQEQIYIPGALRSLVLLKNFFPIQAVIRMCQVIGHYSTVRNIKGTMSMNEQANSFDKVWSPS